MHTWLFVNDRNWFRRILDELRVMRVMRESLRKETWIAPARLVASDRPVWDDIDGHPP